MKTIKQLTLHERTEIIKLNLSDSEMEKIEKIIKLSLKVMRFRRENKNSTELTIRFERLIIFRIKTYTAFYFFKITGYVAFSKQYFADFTEGYRILQLCLLLKFNSKITDKILTEIEEYILVNF